MRLSHSRDSPLPCHKQPHQEFHKIRRRIEHEETVCKSARFDSGTCPVPVPPVIRIRRYHGGRNH